MEDGVEKKKKNAVEKAAEKMEAAKEKAVESSSEDEVHSPGSSFWGDHGAFADPFPKICK